MEKGFKLGVAYVVGFVIFYYLLDLVGFSKLFESEEIVYDIQSM